MDLMEIIKMCGGIATGLGVLIIFLTNFGKLRKYFKDFEAWRRKKIAIKQHPYCASVCPAPGYMGDIAETLKDLKKQIADTKQVSLRTLGDNLNRKVRYYMGLEYMPQGEKTQMLAEFMTYYFANGNGNVLMQVGLAMNLPTELGGHPYDIDMSVIIERETERHAQKQHRQI